MVIFLVVFMAICFITVDYLLKKKQRIIEESEAKVKSPIFLSPEKALKPLGNQEKRMHHLSHTWALPNGTGNCYVGYDSFISYLFHSKIRIGSLPAIRKTIRQGEKIWDIKLNDRSIAQFSPVSGSVVGINPACAIGIPLRPDEIEKSWVVKINPSNFPEETNNLMDHDQANILNKTLREEAFKNILKKSYINDGGNIDPSFVMSMNDEEWKEFVRQFFPHHSRLNP